MLDKSALSVFVTALKMIQNIFICSVHTVYLSRWKELESCSANRRLAAVGSIDLCQLQKGCFVPFYSQLFLCTASKLFNSRGSYVERNIMLQSVDERGLLRLKLPNGLSHLTDNPISLLL